MTVIKSHAEKLSPVYVCSAVSIVGIGKDALRKDFGISVTNEEKHNNPGKMNFRYEHFVAGISGGTVSTILLHPLDLLKIRFAVNDGMIKTAPKYSGLINGLNEIVKSEGVRGLYRGMLPNMLGSGASWGLYFFFYKSIRNWMQDGDPNKVIGIKMNLLATAEAGVMTNILTNPLWVIKTRMCLQYAGDVALPEYRRYSGITDAMRKIYRTEGFKGFYRGLVPGMFGVTHGCIQFVIYEEAKTRYNLYREMPLESKLSFLAYVGLAAFSKLVAASATYPYQVIRTRLQDHHHDYKGSLDCISRTWRYEGWRGFYKGLSFNLRRVIPATAITFVVYENVSRGLLNLKKLRIEQATPPEEIKTT